MNLNIPELVDKHKFNKIKSYPVNSNRISQLGDDCLRKLVHYRKDWSKAQTHSLDTQYIFDEGNYQEEIIIAELQKILKPLELSFVNQQERVDIKEYQIAGAIDGIIAGKGEISVPVEIKSCSPYVFDSLHIIQDFHKFSWTKKYPAQIVLYLYAKGLPEGMLLMKNKSTGKFKQFNIKIEEWLEYCEELLQKAEEINYYLDKLEYPQRTIDEKNCGMCPFKHLCLPDIENQSVEIKDDPVLEEKLDLYFELKESKVKYEKLDEEIKKIIKGKTASIGKYFVTGKWSCRTGGAKIWTKSITKL